MKYNQLEVVANRHIKRVGRGISAGQGKTAGRGTKGQKVRTGKKLRPGFSGGSRSMVTAVPKAKGFKSLKAPTQVVYIGNLAAVKDKTIDNFSLYEAGLIASPYQAAKIILKGEFNQAITLKVAFASKSVKQLIVQAGGQYIQTAVPIKAADKK